MREQLLEGFEAAGGGSDADYRERSVFGLSLLGAAGVRLVRIRIGALLPGNSLLRRPLDGLVYQPARFCLWGDFCGGRCFFFIVIYSSFHDFLPWGDKATFP